MPALARGNKTFPVGDRQIHRRQRARAQDRPGDDDARGRLLMNYQIGADPQHRRLQGHTHDLGGRTEAAGDVAGALIAGQIILVGLGPAPSQAAGHPHCDQNLGVAAAGGGEIVAPRSQAHGFARRLAGQGFGQDGEEDQNDRPDQGGQADHDVEGETDRQIERQPRQIEQRARPHAGEKRPYVVEIAQRLQALIMAAGDQRQANHGVEHPAAEGFVERGADPHQNASPDQVENALGNVQSAGEDHEADQRRHAAAWKHAVINLEHEKRAGQVQKVDRAAHGADAEEGATAAPQRIAEFRPGRRIGKSGLPALHRQILGGGGRAPPLMKS